MRRCEPGRTLDKGDKGPKNVVECGMHAALKRKEEARDGGVRASLTKPNQSAEFHTVGV